MSKNNSVLLPVSPGELLLEEFLIPKGISEAVLANTINQPVETICAIIAGNLAIDEEIDEKLSEYFGLSQGYWLRAQAFHELNLCRED